jgi:phosphoribosyl 1,2-cyclic phosphodiesterase
MRVRFWGVRGACAATRAEVQGVGGNTPCVEVRDSENNLIVLDMGIGLYWLGRSLLAGPHGRGQGSADLLLSHTHWDHIQGFPFFVPAYIPGNRVKVWGGAGRHIESILEGQLNPTYSPLVTLSNLDASLKLEQLPDEGSFQAGKLLVRHRVMKNGTHHCMGYRLEEGGRSLAYLAELQHGEEGELNDVALDLAQGADLVIHESFYTNEEHAQGGLSLAGPRGPRASGHSSFRQATDLALKAGARRLRYFYHHPDHDDATIEAAVVRERDRVGLLQGSLEVDTAREGAELDV